MTDRTSHLELEQHDLFATALLEGLKGQADKEGYEPDGVVTVDELVQYLEREIPRLAREHGKTKEVSQQMELPSDVANGMVFTLLKNIEPTPHPTTLSMVVGTPKPRIVKLEITPVDEEPFLVGDSKRKALHYDVHVKIEGVVGLAAQAARKQPPDTHAWILHDEAPVMVRSEGPLYEDGPVWRIELTSPTWPHDPAK